MYNLTDLEVEIGKMLGIDDNRIKELDLAKEKNKLFNKAFRMREDGETIPQEEADKLNNLLYCIQSKLELCSDYHMAIDYIINFNSFVKDNEYYNVFAW